jgi:hypothetical protein
MIERCKQCGEQVYRQQWNDHYIHRYNLSEKCPDGSGMIRVGNDPYAEQMAQYERLLAQVEKQVQAEKQRKESEAQEQEGKSDDSDMDDDTDDAEGSESEESEDSESAEEEADNDSDNEGDEDEDDTDEGEVKDKKKKPSSDSSGESEQDTPPPSPNEWALKAAQDINKLWQERVRVRGYKPTDEELAKMMLEHSKR